MSFAKSGNESEKDSEFRRKTLDKLLKMVSARASYNRAHGLGTDASNVVATVWSSHVGLIGEHPPTAEGYGGKLVVSQSLKELKLVPDDHTDEEYGLLRILALRRFSNDKEQSAIDNDKWSKDGELYLVIPVERLIAKHIEAQKSNPKSDLSVEIIRIDIIGPRGTCQDCQAALKKWKDLLNAKYMKQPRIEICTRWTGGQIEPEARVDSATQSHVYGGEKGRVVSQGVIAGVIKTKGGTNIADVQNKMSHKKMIYM